MYLHFELLTLSNKNEMKFISFIPVYTCKKQIWRGNEISLKYLMTLNNLVSTNLYGTFICGYEFKFNSTMKNSNKLISIN